MRPTLFVFLKPPRMGLAKTRLAHDIGPVEAQRINRYCHARAMRAARGGPWRTILAVAPDVMTTADPGGLWPERFERWPQGRGDLGDRLARAFRSAPPGPVAVIGTDAPDMSAQLIRRAFKRLQGHDVVFGPADDGGFWLFAAGSELRRRGLAFSPVRWSSPHAMADLVATLPAQSRIAQLPMLIDLDDAASLQKWRMTRNRP